MTTNLSPEDDILADSAVLLGIANRIMPRLASAVEKLLAPDGLYTNDDDLMQDLEVLQNLYQHYAWKQAHVRSKR